MPHLSTSRSAGDFVYVSGRLALNEAGQITGPTIAEQTRCCMNHLATALTSEGLTLSDVVKTTVWLVEVSDYLVFDEVYAEFFVPPLPARSAVIAGLAIPNARIEIEAIALRPSK